MTKSSPAGWATTLEPHRKDPLWMEGTIVGENAICFIDTPLVGALVSPMISPVHKTIGIRGNLYVKVHVLIPQLSAADLKKIKDL